MHGELSTVADPRPIAPLAHSDSAEHRRLIAMRANVGLPIDGTVPMVAPLILSSYDIADLPDASLWENALVMVNDDVGGSIPAFSDGTVWRRLTDRAQVSTT